MIRLAKVPSYVIILITGPSAAGKSTVARLLARRLSKGVCLEGDIFRRCIISGRKDMSPNPSDEALTQLSLRYKVGAMVADAYFQDGYSVIIEDVVAGEFLEKYQSMIKGRPLYVVGLLPSAKTITERETKRTNKGYDNFSVSWLYEIFERHTPKIGLWIDNSQQSPEETVEKILKYLKETGG